MNLNRQRDYRSYPQFQNLVHLCEGDEIKAVYIFDSLWNELGYQAETYGTVGQFLSSNAEQFCRSLKLDFGLSAITKLVQARILIPNGEDLYLCPMFEFANRDLFKVSERKEIMTVAQFEKRQLQVKAKIPPLANQLSDQCWLDPRTANTRLAPSEMNHCMWVIRVLDTVTGRKERKVEEFTPGLIADAIRVTARFTPGQMEILMRRMHLKAKNLKSFPRPTERTLAFFDDAVLCVLPDDGFIEWNKQVYAK